MIRPFFRPAAFALILSLGAAACDNAADSVVPFDAIKTDAQSIADGRVIAEAQCANCHALDNDAKIRPEDPPPLRYLLAQYNPDTLSENFQAGLHVGHEMMPDFVFGPLGAEVLLAYMVSIQQEPPAPE
jgi:mono/diheme cytochrome c family protein